MATDARINRFIQHETISADGLCATDFGTTTGGPTGWFLSPIVPGSFDPAIFGPVTTAGTTSPATTTSGVTSASVLGPVTDATSGLKINVSYAQDAQSWANYSSLQTAVNSAVSYLEGLFKNTITININLGYGTLGDTTTTVPGSAVGASESQGFTTNYATLRVALQQSATSADDAAAVASLPTADPTNGGTFYVPDAQAAALGLANFGNQTLEGNVGLSTTQTYSFSQSAVASGTYDLVGVLEHEITEIMGRIGTLDTAPSNDYTLMDLFRYSGVGQRVLTPGAGSFSVDGGTTLLKALNGNNGEDFGDWAGGGPVDAFAAVATQGTDNAMSTTDVRVMDVLGYDLACFTAGTRIAGEFGDIPVERLQAGDRVQSHLAGLATVRWVGHSRIDCTRHPDPLDVLPVRIAVGAFGPEVPRRDLFLSPEHAVAVDGVLIPIRLLLNGGSIAQVPLVGPVHYCHVELDRHDLLQAEGLPAESYLDTGNRGAFANAGTPRQLHPRFSDAQARRESQSCLTLLLDPARVRPVWQALARRSETLGYPLPRVDTTTDPAPRLMVADRPIQPAARSAESCCFVLPDGVTQVRLVSRHVRPATLRPWLDDRRQLGLMVRAITLSGTDGRMELAMDNPALADGWWAAECDPASIWRWTDGDAVLPVPPGTRTLTLRLGEALAYPVATNNPPTEPSQSAVMRAA